MEKDSCSGQLNHIRPLASLSGSIPEKTVTDASDTVATLRVSTSSGAMARRLRRTARSRPADTPSGRTRPARTGTAPARHMSQDRGGCYQHKTSQQEGQVADEPGDQPKKEVPNDQDARVHRGDDGIVVAVSVFQHLAAQKIYGQFVQDIFRELIDRFIQASSPQNSAKSRRWCNRGQQGPVSAPW